MTISVARNFLTSDEFKSLDSVQELVDSNALTGTVYLKSYYDNWQNTLAGPKGGHFVHRTGATAAAPTVGSPVAPGTIGTGAQAGYYWSQDGFEWEVSNDQIRNPYMYGCYGDDSNDDTINFNNAIQHNLGRRLDILNGVYRISGQLLIPYSNGSGTVLAGESQTGTQINLVGATNTAVIRVSASYCEIFGFRINSDSLTNSGIRIAPEDETQTTVRVGQNYNYVHHIQFNGSMLYGVVLRPGPDVGGPDSSCFHNRVYDCQMQNNVAVGVYLTSGVNASSAPANRNWIQRNYMTGNMNCGVYNEGADTTWINENSFEGIDFIGAGPLATASAVYIDNFAPSGNSNNGVVVSNNRFEGNTIDIENHNSRLQIFGGNHDRTKCIFLAQGGADPLFVLGGFDYSLSTFKLPGYKYQTNSQEAIPNSSPVLDNGLFLLSTEDRLSNYRIATAFTPFVSDVSNTFDGSKGETYSIQVARWWRVGNEITGVIRFRLSSLGTLTVGDGVRIGPLPFTALNVVNLEFGVEIPLARLLNLPSALSLTGTIAANTNYIQVKKWDSTTGPTNLLISELSSDGDLTLSFKYSV